MVTVADKLAKMRERIFLIDWELKLRSDPKVVVKYAEGSTGELIAEQASLEHGIRMLELQRLYGKTTQGGAW